MTKLRLYFCLCLCFFLSLPLWSLSELKEAEDRRDVNAPALLEAISSKNSFDRAQAAIALGRIQKPEGIEALLKLSNDRNFEVRKNAIFSLGQLGWNKSFSNGRENEISEHLNSQLKNSPFEIKKQLIEALGKIALEKTPSYVLPYLKDTSPLLRKESIIALYRYRLVLRLRDNITNPTPLSDDQISELTKLAKDPNSEVKKALAFYFSKVKDERGKAAIVSLLNSTDLWTRFFALSALTKLPADETLKNLLLRATEDSEYFIRVAALQASPSFDVVHLLNPALRGDPSFHVRSAYAQALGTMAQHEASKADAVSKLQELFLDSNISVKSEALLALSNFNENISLPFIKKALQSKDWQLRSAAAKTSENLDAPNKVEILTSTLNDLDPRVRVAALESLSRIEDDYAYPLIQKALSSHELSERGTAIGLLSSRKEPQRFADAFECYHSSLDEKWVELREEIVKLWSSENTDQTTQYLRTAVLDKNTSVAMLAANILKERGISDFPQPNAETELSFSPYRELEFRRNPKITFETTKGAFTLELFHRVAPIHTANMVGFAKAKGYHGLPIHRVVSNFVIQGGDPDKSGWGSAGYSLRAEINEEKFQRASLGMPRSTGFDTGGVQFFINHIPTPHLDGQYTVFGKVSENIEVIDQLEIGDVILETKIDL